ncbi:energy-coupling factor ABC transporter substrate-binding protein [Pseudonocardia yuanmonensis]|uniref:Cobalt transport protein CbiN n=1 Tax=Pseudonocardia yuanmonensis TaxID=1095914 RepID=A0ABP8W3F9_9PSEU
MRRSTLVNWLLVLAVVALAALPLLVVQGEWGGADGVAQDAISESHPDYEPWFTSIYEPPSGEVASGLFALQAAIGAGIVGYYFGVARTKRRLGRGTTPQHPGDTT